MTPRLLYHKALSNQIQAGILKVSNGETGDVGTRESGGREDLKLET